MNKRKKLSLPIETIRTLTESNLTAVAGAVANTYMAGGGQWCSTCWHSRCCTEISGCEPTTSC